jgi:magnesium chelatase family protein
MCRGFCTLGEEEHSLLKIAVTELNFNAGDYSNILKVSRTIADLAKSGNSKARHLSKAIQYRGLDRKLRA